MRKFLFTLIVLSMTFLPGCGSSQPDPQSTSTEQILPQTPAPSLTPAATVNPYYKTSGGGEPRTPGYWLLWNSCAPDNRAEIAAANGGRAAGWIILDDLLADPGILVGSLIVSDCQQAVNLLQQKDIAGADKKSDLAYTLAAQLLAAELNLAAGAGSCPAAEDALSGGQLFLVGLGFTGSGEYQPEDANLANTFIENLQQYNLGKLCR